jgi:F0F1-type ATP synthase membrane subunit c/vacuolar-type H+-ATPase subunit K
MRNHVFFFIGFFITCLLVAPSVVAQAPVFHIALTYTIDDKDAAAGDIMSLENNKEGTLVRAKTYGDEAMYGVLVADPIAVYRTNKNIPLIRDGTALVNVTTLGGAIKPGDFITSSPVAGKGQKAEDIAGYMLGVALSGFDGKGGKEVTVEGKKYQSGQIRAAIGIGPASPVLVKAGGGFLGTLKQLSTAFLYNIRTSKQTERIIRYILAALIAIIAIIVSFRTFGGNVTKGIEAIGRNPLAKMSIQSMIVVNVVLIFTVCLGGILLSLAIISL